MTGSSYNRLLAAIDRRTDLTFFEKTLLRRVLMWSRNDRGACWAKNETLAREIGCTPRHITRGISQLRQAGFIDAEIQGRRGVRGNFDRLLRPTARLLSMDREGHADLAFCPPCHACSIDSQRQPQYDRKHERKAVADRDAPARETDPRPSAAAAPLSLEERARRVFGGEAGRKGGEVAPKRPADRHGTAPLPGKAPPLPECAPVDTSQAQDSRFTASEVAEPPEVATAAAELRRRGLDGASPETWVRQKGAARCLEVCRWADRQPWRGDPEAPAAPRVAREISVALRDGYGTAPLPGSEAEAGLKADQPRRTLHPCSGRTEVDPAYQRYLRGEQTEGERQKEAEKREAIAALRDQLKAKGWGGVS